MTHTYTFKRPKAGKAGRGGSRGGQGSGGRGRGKGGGVDKKVAAGVFSGRGRTLLSGAPSAAATATRPPPFAAAAGMRHDHGSQRLAFVRRMQEDLDDVAALVMFEREAQRQRQLSREEARGGTSHGSGSVERSREGKETGSEGAGGGNTEGKEGRMSPSRGVHSEREVHVLRLSETASSDRGAPDRASAPDPHCSPAPSDVIDLCADSSGDEEMVGRRKCGSLPPSSTPLPQLTSSAGVARRGATAKPEVGQLSSTGRGFTGGSNPFLDPPRYIPPGGEAAADLSLRVHETVHIFDSALARHTAFAVLDTGNAGNTMITRRMASALGLMSGLGGVRTVAVRGVVAGATERVPVIPITYELKGKRLCVMAAVTEASLGCDLLISIHDIREFESDGYRLSTR